MKKIYLLLIAFTFTTVGFGQIEILNQPLTSGSLPSGWTQTDVTFTTTAGGYANFTTIGALLTSPTFDASSYTSVRVDFDVAKFGSGTDGPLRLEYSLNGGTSWILAANSTTPLDANYQANMITINSVSSTMRIRFNRAPSQSQKRLKNVIVYGFAPACTAPMNQATTFTTGAITASTAVLNWVRPAGGGDNVLVIMRQGAAVTSGPSNGTNYTNANSAYGTPTAQLGTTGNYIVYNGPASSVNVTNLIQHTRYHVAIYEYNNAGFCYRTPALINNFIVSANVDCAGSGLNDGFCYGNSQTITRGYSASTSATPLQITFTAGTLEANGSGTWDDLIIYNGTDATGPVLYNSDLNGNTINGRTFTASSGKIFFTLVTDSSNSCATAQQTAIAYTLSCVTACTTPTNVTSLNATPANQQIALSWINGSCFDEILVVAKANTAVTAAPTGDGSAYTASAAFGPPGTQIATDEYVVYKGIGTSVTVTNLTNGTPYHFRVYARKGTTWSTGVAANATPIAPPSTVSNIVDNSFTPTADINYSAFSATSGLTTTNAIKIGEFRIQDGGNTPPDADALATTLTALGFTVQNFGDLRALALFDGTTNVKEVTAVTATTSFTGITGLAAPDNGSKVFSVYATFKTTVTDNNQIRLTIASATADPAGSTFAAGNAGAAATSIAGDANRIEVTATALNFVQQPTNSIVNEVMAPSPTVRAVDINANRDLDYVTPLSLTTTGTFAGSATTTATPVAGIATFNNLLFSAPGTGLTVTTVSSLTNTTSTAFDINTVGWQIGMTNQLYTIDFDNTVTNVNNGTYAGTGFRPSPSIGQLNSGAWASTGMSDGALAFGGTRTTGDYSNGTSIGGETAGGFYAFEVAPSNFTFGVQPTGSDFAPGNVTLKAQNQTGQTVTSVRFQYIIYVRNDQGRSSSFNFSYSNDNVNYANAGSLDYTSPTTASGADWIAVPRNLTVTGLNIPDGAYVYARWTSDDVAGSGSRDEFGLDDIQVIFNPIPASSNSNIVETGFDEPDNINYLAFSATSALTTANAIKIGEFSLQDGGNSLNDADNLSTILTNLSFTIQNFDNLAALAIFDGTTNVSEVTNVNPTTEFTDLNIIATDNSNKVFSVYATFKSTVTDNHQLQLTISSAVASIVGSGLAALNAGGAQTSVIGDDNRIEVTATALSFVQQPSNVVVNQTMTPAVTVSALDANANLDVDYTTDVSIISTGTLSGSPVTVTPTSGVATFSNLIHTTTGTALVLTASNGAVFANSDSSLFDVLPVTVIIAIEDFDGTTPNWSNDIASQLFVDPTSPDEGLFIQPNSGNNTNFSGNSAFGRDLEGETGEPTLSPYVFTFDSVDVSLYTSMTFSFDYYAFANADAGSYELFFGGVGQGPVVFYNDPDTVPVIGTISVPIPNGTTTVALIISGTLNGGSDVIELDNFKIIGAPPIPVDYIYNIGWTPGDPSGVSNRFDNISIVAGTTNITAPTAAAAVTVNVGTTLNINDNASLDIKNNLSNNGTLTLQSVSNAYSSIVVPSVIGSGTFNYNRHVNGPAVAGSGGNDLISAPFTGQTFGVFASNNTNIVTGPNVGDTRRLFGPFDKSIGQYVVYDIVTNAGTTLDAGVGYRAASTGGGTFTFTGVMNTGSVDTPISISGPQFAIWNLIGNPYPSYIKLSDFLATNSSKFNASRAGVYGYTGTSNSYEIWNSAYALANPNAMMTPGQGFLVASNMASVNVNFTSAMRSTGSSDDFIAGRNAPIAYMQIKANISSKDYTTDFYFTDVASRGLNPGFDSGVFGSGAGSSSIYSRLVQENTGVDMGIQSIAYADLNSDVSIPLGINVPQGQQVTVSMINTRLPDGVEVYLEDALANTFTLLNNSDYIFTPTTNLNNAGRFFLRFNSNTLSTETTDLDRLQIYTLNQTLFVNGLLNAATTVTLFDIQGRKVLTTELKSGSTNNTLDVSNMSSGVYIVKLNNTTQQKTQRVIIK